MTWASGVVTERVLGVASLPIAPEFVLSGARTAGATSAGKAAGAGASGAASNGSSAAAAPTGLLGRIVAVKGGAAPVRLRMRFR